MLLCSGDSRDASAVRAAILAQAEKIGKEGIDQERFLRMKRSALGRRIRALDSFDATCFRICAYHFSDFDYFRFPEIYRSIEKDEIRNFIARIVTEERSCLSVIQPISE
jgi:predicted Zn-dependent peptidase